MVVPFLHSEYASLPLLLYRDLLWHILNIFKGNLKFLYSVFTTL